MNKPSFIMMVGLPGSGKSTYAKTLTLDGKPYIIHSSDKLREELYGDAAIQGDNNKLFAELHKRIKDDLRRGENVVYDATNIKKKNRIAFLKELKDIPCYKDCVVMATEYRACEYNNEHRERKVPPEVIQRMYLNYQPPHESEGFREIVYIFTYLNSDKQLVSEQPNDRYALSKFFNVANTFDQENSHHKLTLGEHCAKSGEYIQNQRPNDFWLLMAALIHDIGKLDTKTRFNSRGVMDGECHYYNHNCAGAYKAMFCLSNIEKIWGKPCPMSYVTNLIYYHMHPYLAWKQSEKAKERDKRLLGNELFNDIMLLHEADLAAH